MKRVRELIASRRKGQGLSAAEVAAKSGVTAQTIRAIEKGGNPPKLDTLARICKAMNTSLILEFKTKDRKTVRIQL